MLTFSAIFCPCMITRQQIVKKMPINYARNSKKKVPMSNFCRHLEIGKSVQLYLGPVFLHVILALCRNIDVAF
jgi:hypothetical protein